MWFLGKTPQFPPSDSHAVFNVSGNYRIRKLGEDVFAGPENEMR